MLAVVLALALNGCSTLGASGPGTRAIRHAVQKNGAVTGIKIVEVTDDVARRVISNGRGRLFSEVFGDGLPAETVIGRGDVLDVDIWEAPPAALFGTAVSDPRATSSVSTARATSLPQQMVDSRGNIAIPFAGTVSAVGRTPTQIEREIERRLTGLAHQPQAIVRLARNANANVTVVGDVVNSARVPLTPKGERLLDVLASVGGVRQPVGKMTVQVTRGPQLASMALESVIRDPAQNIRLRPDDVLTALYQPFSFTALGAIGNNAEISFEGTGITLSQALGRVGGLRDERADVRGVFIFRLEDPVVLGADAAGARTTPDGKVPVIYRVDMKDPGTFFVAQSFPIHDKDVMYVSNAPLVDLQKFVNMVSSLTFTIVNVANAAPAIK